MEAEREREVLRGWKRLCDLWPAMLKAFDSTDEDDDQMDVDTDYGEVEREWMMEAEKLVETFRETRKLFSSSRVRFRDPILTY